MKISALVGSPQKGGNTDLLIDQILRGSESKGTSVEKLYLYEHEIERVSTVVDAKRGCVSVLSAMRCPIFIQSCKMRT